MANPEINDAKNLEVGKEVSGYVKSVGKSGCFVALSRNVDALIKLTNLADGFVVKPSVEFPTGRLVRGRIVSADAKTNRVEMSLRTSQSDSKTPNKEAVASLKVGDVVMGTVRSVQSYGVFVTLDESGISGLCHISMFADMHVKDDLANHVRAGERVRAKIMKVDYETSKVSLGIKASVFGDDDDDIDEGDKVHEYMAICIGANRFNFRTLADLYERKLFACVKGSIENSTTLMEFAKSFNFPKLEIKCKNCIRLLVNPAFISKVHTSV